MATANPSVSDIVPSPGYKIGRVKWFNVAKGWGFVTPQDGGQEVFVHQVRISTDVPPNAIPPDGLLLTFHDQQM